jgi:DNA-damage-inducible protein J
MAKIHTTIRVDEEVYMESRKILERLGLNFSQAVNIFLTLVKENRGLPFEVKLPNAETMKVIEEIEKGENLIEVENLEELKEYLGVEDK